MRERVMKYCDLFLFSFLVVFLIYFFLIINSKKGRTKLKKGAEAKFLEKISNISLKKIDDKKFAYIISFVNSLIISMTFVCISFIHNFILQLIVAFPLFLFLIIICYQGVGKWLAKKK